MNNKNILYLFSFLYDKDKKIKFLLFISVFASLISIAFNILTPFLLKRIADLYNHSQAISEAFMILAIGYSVFWTLTQLTTSIRDYCMCPVLERAVKSLNLTLMNHLHCLSHSFYTKTNIGSLINSFERVHTTYQEMVWGILFSILPSFVTIILASLLICYFYSFKYALSMLLLLLVYFFFSLSSTKHATALQKDSNRKYKEVVSYIVDTLMNFELVKYFCNHSYEQENLSKILTEREKAKTAALLYTEIIKMCQWLIIGLFFILTNILISIDIRNHYLTVGDFILINSYIIQFFAPLSNLGVTFRNIKKSLSDLDELISLLHLKSEIEMNEDFPSLDEVSQMPIVFKNVKFGYDPQTPILKEISFEIPAQGTLAIIGPSGSGKTTIAKLLFRLYNIQEGKIFIGNQEIAQVNLSSLQSIIGIVPQEPCIFHKSIKYNISYGNPTASDKEIRAAAQLANIDDFILSLPQQYETLVGPRGLNLSGGEKQRIAIARALLKKPKIMIFDEATSSLDKKNELVIQQNLYNLMKKFTSIVITHKPTTAMFADEILILIEGNIVAKGTHHELLNSNSYYKLLWEKSKKLKTL